MAGTYFVSPQGNDQNAGTSEAQAWKSLTVSARLKPGDVLIALPGTYSGTFAPPSGSSAAPITLRAKTPGTVTLDGSVRVDALPWQRSAKGWSAPFSRLVFGVFQRTYETAGKLTSFADRHYNQYNSNPGLDLQGVPAEFKWDGGVLRLNPIEGNPSAEPLIAAVTETALMLNGRSHVVVEDIATRGYKHAVATNGGTGIYLNGCRFGYSASTAVWLVGLADSAMTYCVVQGGGSWLAHVEDLIHTERVGTLRLESLDLSYGGHSGLIMLDGIAGSKITLRRVYMHDMGGSLLTLKRSVDNLLVEDCWLSGAAKSTAVDAHKVPHAGVQLSGKGHVFRNTVFRDNGKDILCSSDGNPDSNPVCSDIVFDRCTFSGSEAGAVEGQEYAPAGRVERMTWRDCIIKGEVALFYAGQGDRNSNRLVNSQVVGTTRGVVLQGSGSGTLPNTGSTLAAPLVIGGPTPPQPPQPPQPPTTPPATGKPRLDRLTPAAGPPGSVVRAEGSGFGSDPYVIASTRRGMVRLAELGGNDTAVSYTVPADATTGPVGVRNTRIANPLQQLSDPLTFTVTGTAPPPPADLRITITASPNEVGASFSGTVLADGPLPAGSTLTLVVATPDGRQGNAREAIAGEVPAPAPKPTPPPAGNEVAEVVRLHNLLRSGAGLPALQAPAMEAEDAGEAGEIGEAWTSAVARQPRQAVGAEAVALPLSDNAQLRDAAQKYAQRMFAEGFFSHNSPEGGTPWERIAAAGYTGRTLGENLAKGFSTPAAAMQALFNSPGHRANIMNPSFREIGVGIAGSGTGKVWCITYGG
jgi:hypothetical protein